MEYFFWIYRDFIKLNFGNNETESKRNFPFFKRKIAFFERKIAGPISLIRPISAVGEAEAYISCGRGLTAK